MKIHRIETGKVRIKKNQISKKESIAPSITNVLFGKEWSDWLPIYAWIIEHPEGIILVDTGETSKTGQKGYLPRWHPYYNMAVEFDVNPQDEIGLQLSDIGIDKLEDISKVILTHLHTDHAGGMYYFPTAEFIICEDELKAARGISGILEGYLPHRWPQWLHPTLIKFAPSKYSPFNRSLSITKDRKVIIVPTPGHSPGHMSVIVEMEDYYYFLAGDASYNQENMLQGTPDGVGNESRSVDTLEKIQLFTQKHPTIYLPTHDPEVPERMDRKLIAPNYLEHLNYIK